MGGFLKFVVKNGPAIWQVIKKLKEAYDKGHAAGLWSEQHGKLAQETIIFEERRA